MAVRVNVPPNAEIEWSRVLGYFIWSMGQIEWQCYEWGRQIGGDTLKDSLIEYKKFGRRQAVLLAEVMQQQWPEERKKRATVLWTKAKGFARFRNIVAHSPIIGDRRDLTFGYGIVDVRGLKGAQPRACRFYRAPLVYSTAVKMQALASELIDFWK